LIKNKVKNNKSGFMLAEVLLAVMMIGVIITGLLTFFSHLRNQDESEQMAAMAIISLHTNLQLFDSSSLGSVTASGARIDGDTDIIGSYPDIFLTDAKNISKTLMGNSPTYNFNNGLSISFNNNTISCPSLLKFDLGFDLICLAATGSCDSAKSLKSIASSIPYCDNISVDGSMKKWLWLKNTL